MMEHYSDKSCEEIFSVAVALDKANSKLTELPEHERLATIIALIDAAVIKLEEVLKSEGF